MRASRPNTAATSALDSKGGGEDGADGPSSPGVSRIGGASGGDAPGGYRLTFERLLEKLPEKSACRLMVQLLELAHGRGCESELAAALDADLAAGQLPDIAALRARFAADPAPLPDVVVHLAPLADYEALLGGDVDQETAQETETETGDAP